MCRDLVDDRHDLDAHCEELVLRSAGPGFVGWIKQGRVITDVCLRAWALHFAARGWHVFPITPGAKKPPVIDRWEARASTDPEQITYWWRHIPHTIGIATGPSRLVVIDLDTPKPGELVPDRWAALGIGSGAGVLRALAREHGITLTPTYTASIRQRAGTCTTPPRPGRRCAIPTTGAGGRSTPGRTEGTSSHPAARCPRWI